MIICVLGMHRSGTSCLAGTLEESGVHLGDVYKWSPYNLKGNHENRKIMDLQEDLLRANGGAWDSPPSQVVWSMQHKTARDEIIHEYQGFDCWGFKDPRTLWTLEGWMEALPDLTLVGIFRNPILVAESLTARNGFSTERGIDLWNRYNEQLLAYHDAHRFPLISFDGDESEVRRSLSKLLDALALPSLGGKQKFFAPELRHTSTNTSDFPKRARLLYEKLRSLALCFI